MPSPFYNTDTTYGLRALLGTSNGNDIDAGFAALRDDILSKMKPVVPVVTTIPTVGPTGSGPLLDGQECYLQVDATNGVYWHLRYRSSSASTYKWEFLGGPPLYAEVAASENTTSASYAALTTAGPSITLPTLPSGGDFDVEIGAALVLITGATAAFMSYAIGGTGAVDPDAIFVAATATVTDSSVHRARRKTGLASATALTAKYRVGGGGTIQALNRYMRVTPVRVG